MPALTDRQMDAKLAAAMGAPKPVAPAMPTGPIVTDRQMEQKLAAQAADLAWSTVKVGTTGKTQAQLDAAAGAATAVADINALGNGITSTIDPTTGKVKTTSPTGTALGSDTPIVGKPVVVPPVVPVVVPAGKKPTEITDATKDAFAVLTDLFTSYGLGELATEIGGYMTAGMTAGEALIKLKTNPSGAYAERFAGNFARQKAGLNMLSEADYMGLENSYANTLKSYGLGDMLSATSKDNWKTFSNYIANDISAVEFKDRISTAEDRVINADAATKAQFKQWYPNLTDKDLVAYFLNPSETIGKLKEKVTSAEIGGAFTGQGLSMDMASATDYAKYGIDRAGALQGASQIKEVLPTSDKLSNIYKEAGINYTQKTGEAEFLKSNQDAAEQRRRLKSMERGSFSGDSGVSSQTGSLSRTTQGSF